MMKGDLVRFANESNGGPVHRVTRVFYDGMIELHDMSGFFADHLFVPASDIGDIPPLSDTTTAETMLVRIIEEKDLPGRLLYGADFSVPDNSDVFVKMGDLRKLLQLIKGKSP